MYSAVLPHLNIHTYILILSYIIFNYYTPALLDECHRAKNFFAKNGKPTKTGEYVFLLQEKLPKARVVYCSATGITEPANMAYMTRLGLWGPQTPFPDGFTQFHQAVTVAGTSMMELVAMELKRQGSYICRTLSYKGAEFKTVKDAISEEDIMLYNETCLVWQELYNDLKQGLEDGTLIFPIKKKAKGDKEDGANNNNEEEEDYEDYIDEEDEERDEYSPLEIPENGSHKVIWACFWGAHQVRRILYTYMYICSNIHIQIYLYIAFRALYVHIIYTLS